MMRLSWFLAFALSAALLSSPTLAAKATMKLPALGGDPAKISVSGLSSGAFMAVQYDVAYSASTIGVGVVAGGPYNCAFVNVGGIGTCMQGAPAGEASYQAALSLGYLGQIDTIDHLAPQKIYLFSGTQDTIVKQSVMDSVRDFFLASQVPADNIQYVNQVPAGHGWISKVFGNLCGTTASPYVNECTAQSDGQLYDQPQAILTQLYGPLQPEATVLSSQPVAFNQREFASSETGMAKDGYVYIPANCRKGAKCAVHVVFHGCSQSADTVGDAVYGKVGYNAWADSNNIIVLYPQVDASNIPFNPQGCWDWWGYSSPAFETQGGPQLSAVRAMVKRLTAQ